MRQLVGKAMSGDFKATKEILQWNRVFEEAVERDAPDSPDVEKDAAVMKAFLARARATQTEPEPELNTTQERTLDNDAT